MQLFQMALSKVCNVQFTRHRPFCEFFLLTLQRQESVFVVIPVTLFMLGNCISFAPSTDDLQLSTIDAPRPTSSLDI